MRASYRSAVLARILGVEGQYRKAPSFSIPEAGDHESCPLACADEGAASDEGDICSRQMAWGAVNKHSLLPGQRCHPCVPGT